MAEVPVSRLVPGQQAMVKKAGAALAQGNFDYAIEVCAEVLRTVPECVAVRRLQHAARRQLFDRRSGLAARVAGWLATGRLLLGRRTDGPEQRFKSAEKLLAADPGNAAALKQLGKAAMALGWPETAVFAFEVRKQRRPGDRNNLQALGDAWLAAGNTVQALQVADAILRVRPVDPAGQDLMRRASIAQMLAREDGDETASVRNLPRSEARTAPREPRSKHVTSEEMTQRLISETQAQIAREPANGNHYCRLAGCYLKLGRPDDALRWLAKARALPGAAGDAVLEKLESDLRRAKLERALAKAEASTPIDETAWESVEVMRRKLAEFRLLEAQRLVDCHPDDKPARHVLGTLLLEAGRIDAAIAQFQQVRRNPQVRIAALLGLGRAFRAKNLPDLAVVQLTTAKRETGAFDDTKKEIVYELGMCLEALGRREEAMEEFKLIYSEDIGFRDVANRIDANYLRGRT